jgi:hypothetical protein
MTALESALLEFLEHLEVIGETHGELFDSEVREAMSRAVMNGFLRQASDYQLPDSFAMFTPEADELVRDALASFLPVATQAARQDSLDTFMKRLNAFQNHNVRTQNQNYYDDFFGWWNPDYFDESGNRAGG